jgi:hypothetical protein
MRGAFAELEDAEPASAEELIRAAIAVDETAR